MLDVIQNERKHNFNETKWQKKKKNCTSLNCNTITIIELFVELIDNFWQSNAAVESASAIIVISSG